MTATAIRSIAGRLTHDEGTPDLIDGALPATAFHGDHGIIRVAAAGARTIVTVTVYGATTTRSFVGTHAGVEQWLRSTLQPV